MEGFRDCQGLSIEADFVPCMFLCVALGETVNIATVLSRSS